MLASQCGLAFEEHSVVLIMSGMGRLISGEAQSGTGGALLAANSSVGGVVSGGACRPAPDHWRSAQIQSLCAHGTSTKHFSFSAPLEDAEVKFVIELQVGCAADS